MKSSPVLGKERGRQSFLPASLPRARLCGLLRLERAARTIFFLGLATEPRAAPGVVRQGGLPASLDPLWSPGRLPQWRVAVDDPASRQAGCPPGKEGNGRSPVPRSGPGRCVFRRDGAGGLVAKPDSLLPAEGVGQVPSGGGGGGGEKAPLGNAAGPPLSPAGGWSVGLPPGEQRQARVSSNVALQSVAFAALVGAAGVPTPSLPSLGCLSLAL